MSMYDCLNDPKDVTPNGDISGPGVLVGFLGTAYLSTLVLTGYYVLAYDPAVNPYGESDSPESKTANEGTARLLENGDQRPTDLERMESIERISRGSVSSPMGSSAPTPALVDPGWSRRDQRLQDWAPNRIDDLFLQLVRKPFRNIVCQDPKLQHTLDHAFSKCMLHLCDTQAVTGLGILVSAYSTLGGDEGISIYHWQLVVYLAWSSNLTHLSGLTFLRKHLSRRKAERRWRALSMTLLYVLLFVALIPTKDFYSSDIEHMHPGHANASSFARCYFSESIARERQEHQGITEVPDDATDPVVGLVISMLLLTFTFATRLVKMSLFSSHLFRHRILHGILELIRRAMLKSLEHSTPITREAGRRSLTSQLVRIPVMAVVMTLRIFLDIYGSMLSEIYWAWTAGIWVSIRVFQTKGSANVDEGQITFGQVLAIFLLVLPMAAISVVLVPLFPRILRYPKRRDTRIREPITLQTFEEETTKSINGDFLPLLDSSNSYQAVWSTPLVLLVQGSIVIATMAYFIGIATVDARDLSDALNFSLKFFGVQAIFCFHVNLFALCLSGHGHGWTSQIPWLTAKQRRFLSCDRPHLWFAACVVILTFSVIAATSRYFMSWKGNAFYSVFVAIFIGPLIIYAMFCLGSHAYSWWYRRRGPIPVS